MVWLNAWPMCSVPVTLGGGNWTTYGWLSVPVSTCWPAAKYPRLSHSAYQRDSSSEGSKLFESSGVSPAMGAAFGGAA